MSSTPDSERWARLERLFHEASERPSESRDAFLADACADDPELLAQVRAMLLQEGFKLPNVFTGAESLLEDEGGGTMPERVGSYRIERELGRGGMGVVYLGIRHRDDFEHQVAIKMLPSAPYDPVQLGRFQNERRILASLQHPGIARLLDGGTTESGIPYVVMDFVDGERIDDYCDRADVTLDDRLRLFSRVCEAVSHAHRRLVVHRDIKPSNILIDSSGDPKLLDFGIAKLVDPAEADVDATSTRIMTLRYASPEQIEGAPIGTGTDVYALGALLYQLTTGERPHGTQETSAPELARRILDGDPQRPSVRANDVRLRGDLDTICLKALQRDPEHRYASVDALRADVLAHLESRPIEAVAPTVGYRTFKFVRRNRVASSAAAVALLAVVLGGAGLTAGLARAQAAEEAAVEEADAARAVTDFLVSAFDQAGADSLLGQRITAVQVLDRGSERIDVALADRPATQVRLKHAMAKSYMGLGQAETAQRLVAEALASLSADAEQRPGLLSMKASLDRRAERVDEAGAAIDEGLTRLESRVDTTSAEAMRRTPEQSSTLIGLIDEAALIAAIRADYETAVAQAERALRLRRMYSDSLSREMATTLTVLSTAHFSAGQPELAAPYQRESLNILEQVLPKDHPSVLHTTTLVAVAMMRTGKPDSALALFEDVLPAQIALLGDPHPDVVQAKMNLGTALMNSDETRSQALLEQALDGFRSLNGVESLSTTSALINLGILAERQGRLRDALDYYQSVAEIRGMELGQDNPRTAYGVMGVANMHRQLGELEAAARGFEQAFEVLRPLDQVPPPALRDYAEVMRGLGRPGDARAAEAEADELERGSEGASQR